MVFETDFRKLSTRPLRRKVFRFKCLYSELSFDIKTVQLKYLQLGFPSPPLLRRVLNQTSHNVKFQKL